MLRKSVWPSLVSRPLPVTYRYNYANIEKLGVAWGWGYAWPAWWNSHITFLHRTLSVSKFSCIADWEWIARQSTSASESMVHSLYPWPGILAHRCILMPSLLRKQHRGAWAWDYSWEWEGCVQSLLQMVRVVTFELFLTETFRDSHEIWQDFTCGIRELKEATLLDEV